jgi:hypothetical protein
MVFNNQNLFHGGLSNVMQTLKGRICLMKVS